MNFRMQSYLFQEHARENLERANVTLASQRSLFFKPYVSYAAHYATIPSSYTLVGRCIQHALALSAGAYLLTRSTLTSTPFDETKYLAWATWQLAHAMIINACNVLVAMLSLISRNAATALNGGYLYEPERMVFDNGEVTDSAPNERGAANELVSFEPEFNDQQAEAWDLENNNIENIFST